MLCQVRQCKPCMARHMLDEDVPCSNYTQVTEVNWARTALQVRQQLYQYGDVASSIAQSTAANQQHHAGAKSTWTTYDGEERCFYADDSGVNTVWSACQAPEIVCCACRIQPLCRRCWKVPTRRATAANMKYCTGCPNYCHAECTREPASSSSARNGGIKFLCAVCVEQEPTKGAEPPPWRTRAQRRNRDMASQMAMRGADSEDEWATVPQEARSYGPS